MLERLLLFAVLCVPSLSLAATPEADEQVPTTWATLPDTAQAPAVAPVIPPEDASAEAGAPDAAPLATAAGDAPALPAAPLVAPPVPPPPPASDTPPAPLVDAMPPPPLVEAPPPAPASDAPRATPAAEQPAARTSRPPRVGIGASLGMNTISGVGMQLVWRTSSHFGWAFGVGAGVSGLRYGIQGRIYFQPIVSSLFFGFDLHGNTGRIVDDGERAPRHDADGNVTGESFTYSTAHSELIGLSLGYHLVWGHFYLEPTAGYSLLVSGGGYRTDPSPEQLSQQDRETAAGDRGGPQLGLTAGFTW